MSAFKSVNGKSSAAVLERRQPEDLRERHKWKHLFRYENGRRDPEDQRDEKVRAPMTWASVLRFWDFARPCHNVVYLLFACTLINQSMTVVMPVVIGRVLDKILPRHDAQLLNIVALGLIFFVILRAFYLYVERELSSLAGSTIVREVRKRLHDHMQTMSLRFLEDYQVGRIVSRIMSDTEVLRNLLLGGFISSLSNALRLFFVAGTLLWIDWRLTLVSCVTLPFFIAGVWRHIGRLKPAHKELSEDSARTWAKASETFSAMRVVKTYNGEHRENLGFARRIHQMIRKGMLVRESHHVMATIWEVSAWLGLVALIWYGGHRVMNGAMTAGELVTFYGLLGLLHGPIAELINISEVVQQAMASIEKIGEVLDEKPEIADKPGAIEAVALKGEVAFENVRFQYKQLPQRNRYKDLDESGEELEDEPRPRKRGHTLDNISFHVQPGQCIALVGPSGSGKSTVINMLARFYDVESGSIKVDGVDIRDYRTDTYRRNLAIVLQDNFLFRGTIRENIAYSRPDATEEEIVRAAQMAGAWEFIEQSEEGLDALCGERGVKLSGGQKQRLSIARAILADPRILILDEATSALDSQAEAQIQASLDELMKGRTTFIIAHRLSTIVNADRILVMEQGRIVESGSHDELLAREGRYFDLFMEQYGKVKFSGRTADAILHWREERVNPQPAEVRTLGSVSTEPPLHVTQVVTRQAPLLGPLGLSAPPHSVNADDLAQVRTARRPDEKVIELDQTKSGRWIRRPLDQKEKEALKQRRESTSGRTAPAPAD